MSFCFVKTQSRQAAWRDTEPKNDLLRFWSRRISGATKGLVAPGRVARLFLGKRLGQVLVLPCPRRGIEVCSARLLGATQILVALGGVARLMVGKRLRQVLVQLFSWRDWVPIAPGVVARLNFFGRNKFTNIYETTIQDFPALLKRQAIYDISFAGLGFSDQGEQTFHIEAFQIQDFQIQTLQIQAFQIQVCQIQAFQIQTFQQRGVSFSVESTRLFSAMDLNQVLRTISQCYKRGHIPDTMCVTSWHNVVVQWSIRSTSSLSTARHYHYRFLWGAQSSPVRLLAFVQSWRRRRRSSV